MIEWPLHRGLPYFPGYFWDHYTEHPAVYDRFAVSTDAGVAFLATLVDLSGLSVLDIAAGTGRTAFAVARRANDVLGVEPDDRMREFANRRKSELGVSNVDFIAGSTDHMPLLPVHSFDLVTAFHGPPFAPGEVGDFVEAFKAFTRPGGTLVVQTTIPQWLHEYQKRLPEDAPRAVADPHRAMEAAFVSAAFRYVDATLFADHQSVDEALATYGFIYGPYAIDWLLEGTRSQVPWGIRTYLLSV